MDNLLIAQSGGPTAAINATLAGILQGALSSTKIASIYGAKNGIEGVLREQFIDLSELVKDKEAIDLLTYTPSSALGTCRYKMKGWKEEEETYRKITEIFEKYRIRYFIYIGGNDSMDTVDKLSEYCALKGKDIVIIGAPKTIDNDLYLTDHSPGFGSAAKYIDTTIAELACDIRSYHIPSVTIVEIMGRNAGWLTASAALARMNRGIGPDLIYLCEREFDPSQFITDVKRKLEEKSGVLVVVSEGIKNKEGGYISDQIAPIEIDSFGHKHIAGAARVLEGLVRKEIGGKVRSIELNIMQRAAAHITSERDIKESLMLGEKALNCALLGETGSMAAILRLSDDPYEVEFISVPVSEVANREKKVPLQWITQDGTDVTNDMLNYIRPLIQGETNIKYENGLPFHLRLF